jgi:hypothetical protein
VYFKDATGITTEPPDAPTGTIEEIVDAVWDNRNRDYNAGCLVNLSLDREDFDLTPDLRRPGRDRRRPTYLPKAR